MLTELVFNMTKMMIRRRRSEANWDALRTLRSVYDAVMRRKTDFSSALWRMGYGDVCDMSYY